uniref:nicotinate-nucleotide adenylyltransferase n=1 Tax=Orrella sp. TaxID=1921583 RepID=UPI0040480B87
MIATKTGGQRRIGLLGGSFDPIHHAHLCLARAAINQANLHEVQFIPAGQPWQRSKLIASPKDRAAMVGLAIANEPGFRLNTIEVERQGPTYTLDTLRALPLGPKYYWLLGADQLINFCTWSNWESIASMVTLLVAIRPQYDLNIPIELDALIKAGTAQIQSLPFEPMATSATRVREYLSQGQSVAEDLSPAVIHYIQTHHLYQTSNRN